MPFLSLNPCLSDAELAELRQQFELVVVDPHSPYQAGDFAEWVADVLMDAWQRRPKVPSVVVK